MAQQLETGWIRSLTAGEFQRQCFEETLDFFKQIRIKESESGLFEKREPTALLSYDSIQELYEKCSTELHALTEDYPDLKETVGSAMEEILDRFFEDDVNGLRLLDAYGDFSVLKERQLCKKETGKRTYLELSASASHIYIRRSEEEMAPDKEVTGSVAENARDKEYLASLMRICKDVRERDREFKTSEMCGIWSGYGLIKRGTTLDFAYKGLGTSGFRERHHTLIFTTDPGDDHIRVTSRSKALMDGIAAHVEHIDRDKVTSKELVEAYRLPAAVNAAKVRLHIGNSVPVTAFIGRPVFENGNPEKSLPTESFEMDKLKSVHMTASACSAMFQNGIADCKVAIERMYLEDAVSFMKSVVGNVFRTPGKQTLAAAFNLNTRYFDNRYHEKPEGENCYILSDPYEIAQTAIQVARDGGFDRVTWDGASNQVPSVPIIEQLSHEQFATLVHRAHECGLQTYFSAGLEAEHVERCVYTGVDGLGIGTSLHYIDPETKLMGAFAPKAIEAVLTARDLAEATIQGRGAVLLARLDRLFFEGILKTAEERKRQELFQAVLAQDVDAITEILEDRDGILDSVIGMEEDGENSIVERGKRTLSYVKNLQKKEKIRKMDIERLEKAVRNGDIDTLKQIFARREDES